MLRLHLFSIFTTPRLSLRSHPQAS